MPAVRRGVLWVGAAIAFGVTGWLLSIYGSANVDRVLSGSMGEHVDFETFHRSAVALLHGEPIYDAGAPLANLNPPLWTVLLAPFAPLDSLVAYRLFAVLTIALVLGAGLLMARAVELPTLPTVLVLAAVLLSSPMMGTVALGQVYGVLMAGLAGAWLADRHGRPVLPGVLIGLVIAVKPTLAPLLLLPIAQRKWPMLRAALAATVGASAVGVLVAGPAATFRWIGVLRAEPLSTFSDNASLPSFVARLGGPAWLGFLLGAVLIVITFVRIREPSDIALWSLTAATLLMSPVAWHNYLVLCFPGALVLARQGRNALVTFLLALPLIGVEWAFRWTGDGPADRIALSLYCFVLLAYWGASLPAKVRQPSRTTATIPAR